MLTMPETMSRSGACSCAYGAELVLTPGERRHAGGDRARREELAAADPRYFIPQQFQNPANPEIHRRPPPRRSGGTPTGGSTSSSPGSAPAGTITGVGQVLKERKPGVQGDRGGARRLPGPLGRRRGTASDPGDRGGLCARDPRHRRSTTRSSGSRDDDAFDTARRAGPRGGVVGRHSSGAAIWAAVQVARRKEHAGKSIVVIVPSFGERYL